jgi:hypothetical protein
MKDVLPKPPIRAIISGPSGAGKGVLTSELLLKHYRGKFSRIYYFSASALVDDNLKPLQKYCEEELGQNPRTDPCLYDTWNEEALEKILERQGSITQMLKARGKRPLHVAVVCDDFADDKKVVRGSLLTRLYLRGRHINVSTFVLTQYYRLLSPSIRTNATMLAVFRERSQKNLDDIIEENAALVDRATLLDMYHLAVSEPHGYLLILLNERDISRMFLASLKARLVPT